MFDSRAQFFKEVNLQVRAKTVLTGLLVTCLAFLVGVKVFRYVLLQSRTSRANQDLQVTPDYLDLGEIWESSHFEWPFVIHNRSHEDKQVEMSASCDCISGVPDSLVIKAGQAVRLNLIFDLTHKSKQDESLIKRDVSVEVFARLLDSPQVRYVWSIRARVLAPYILSSKIVEFSDDLLPDEDCKAQYVEVSSNVPLASLSAISDPVWSLGTKTLPGNKYIVSIKPQAHLPLGKFKHEVSILGKTRSGETLPNQVILLKGNVVDDVKLFPTHLLLGAHSVGKIVQEKVLLYSLKGRCFDLRNLSDCAPPDTSIRVTEKNQNNAIVLITQTIAKVGHQSREVKITVRNHANRIVELPIQIDYYGIQDR